MEESASRIIDANLNRAAEAARVLEDIARFHLSSGPLAEEAKGIRHAIRQAPGTVGIDIGRLLTARDSDGDVASTEQRSPREGLHDVAGANFRRLEEAFRVIEEVVPLSSQVFSDLRYRTYSLEKRMGRLLARRTPEVLGGPCVCVIVTRNMVEDPLEFIREVVEAGAGMIQLREKSMEDRDFIEYASAAHDVTSRNGALLVINDRPDIACAVCADSVHVGQEDIDCASARRIVGEDTVVGVSTHSEEEISAACRDGADYIGFGPVFETKTKGRSPVSPGALKRALALSSVPVYAIGGISPENIREVAGCGARCVAVCASVASARNPGAVVRSMLEELDVGGQSLENLS